MLKLKNTLGWLFSLSHLFMLVIYGFAVGVLAEMLLFPHGPQCLGTLQQCGWALSRPDTPAPLDSGNPWNWILVSSIPGVLIAATLFLGFLRDRRRAPRSQEEPADPSVV